MRIPRIILAIGASLVVASFASADEVIYFTNGTYMKIVSHEAQGEMVRVRLDGTGTMAFPARMVNKIESTGVVIYGKTAARTFANQIAPGMGAQASVGQASAQPQDPQSMARRAALQNGLRTGGAMAGQQAATQYLDGSILRPVTDGSVAGVERKGNHLVIGGTTVSNSARPNFKPARITMKPLEEQGDKGDKAPTNEQVPRERRTLPQRVDPIHVSLVIGLTGPNAAGKGEVARYLGACGFQVHSLSDIVREEAARLGLPPEREHLIRIGTLLRSELGAGVLAERILPRLGARDVVDSIRNPAEVEVLRSLSSFHLLGVQATARLRFERSLTRGRPGDPQTLAEFEARERQENTSSPAGQQLDRTFRLAESVVTNDADLERLHDAVRRTLADWEAKAAPARGLD